MPVKPRSIDAFVALVHACQSADGLFILFQDEIEREGYQNMVFARFYGATDRFDVPYANLPESHAHLYLKERMWEHDPILAESHAATAPFTWIDVMMRKSHSPAARRVMEMSALGGVQGGTTMPFHYPSGNWDLVSLSMRDKRLLNPDRIQVVNMKAYATVQRYLELLALKPMAAIPKPEPDLKACCEHHPQHGQSVGPISDPECKALALVEISWRRYSAGFLDLNRRVPQIVGEGLLQGYLGRGLIEEEPDDLRFNYVFRPSPIGQSHLKACPHAAQWRNEVWSNYVHVHERPIE